MRNRPKFCKFGLLNSIFDRDFLKIAEVRQEQFRNAIVVRAKLKKKNSFVIVINNVDQNKKLRFLNFDVYLKLKEPR